MAKGMSRNIVRECWRCQRSQGNGLGHPVWSWLELRARNMLLAWDDPRSLGRSVGTFPLERFPLGQNQRFTLELFSPVPSAPWWSFGSCSDVQGLFWCPGSVFPPFHCLFPSLTCFLIYQRCLVGAGKSLSMLVNQSKTSGLQEKTPPEPQIMGIKGKCKMAEGTWSVQRYFLAVCSKVWYHFSPGLQGLSPHKFGPV